MNSKFVTSCHAFKDFIITKSTLELDYERANIPMGLNGLCIELIYHDDIVYEG